MNISHTKIHDAKTVVSLSLSDEETQKEIQNTVLHLSKTVEIPGFRKGQAPFEMVVQTLGIDSIYQKMAEDMIQKKLQKYAQELGIKPLGSIQTDLKEVQPLTLEITLHHEPEFSIEDYKNIRVPLVVTQPSKEEIDQVIQGILERLATYETTDEGAKLHDEVTLSIQATSEGEPVEALTLQSIPLRITPGMLFNLEKELESMKTGETKKIHIDSVQESPFAHITGKPLDLVVTINAVKRRQIPQLTDELAKEAFKLENIKEVTDSVQKEIEKNHENQAKALAFQTIKQELLSKTSFTLPENIIENALKEQKDLYEKRASQEGISLDEYFTSKGKETKTFMEELTKEIENEYREFFICENLIRKEGIQIDHDAIHETMKSRYGKDFDHHSREHMETEYQLKKEKLYEQFIQHA